MKAERNPNRMSTTSQCMMAMESMMHSKPTGKKNKDSSKAGHID